MVANDGFLKLTDFGFAKILNEGRTFTICGTPEYIAPEVILNQGHGKAVDWWTLGVLIYEMHAGIDPFNEDDPMGIYKNILRGKIQFPQSFDKDAKSLVKHLLVADLSKRYGNLKDGIIYNLAQVSMISRSTDGSQPSAGMISSKRSSSQAMCLWSRVLAMSPTSMTIQIQDHMLRISSPVEIPS